MADRTASEWPSVVSTGLTPSVFSSVNTRGFTPSGLTPSLLGPSSQDAFGTGDYFSFGSSSTTSTEPPTKRGSLAGPESAFTNPFDDGADQHASLSSELDAFAGLHRRKRAMSSPALLTPGGALHHIGASSFARAANDLPVELQLLKRPRPGTGTTTSSSTSRALSSLTGGGVSEDSPSSSAVLTPPDTVVPPPPSILNSFVDPFAKPTDESDLVAFEPLAPTNEICVGSQPPLKYEQFSVPLSQVERQANQAPSLVELDNQRSLFAMQGQVLQQPAPNPMAGADSFIGLNVTIGPSSYAAVNSPSRKTGKAKSSRRGKKAASVTTDVDELDSDEGGTEEQTGGADHGKADPDRRQSLERNRLAACKSRRKKKEKVQQLEASAVDVSTRNLALQKIARELRGEVEALRRQVDTHDGCSCAHVKGYLEREQSGGGIPTIDALAGRVFSVDYSNVPSMGSEDDCYRDHFNPEPEVAELMAKAGKRGAGGGARDVKSAKEKSASTRARPGARTRQSTVSEETPDSGAESFAIGAPIPLRHAPSHRPNAPALGLSDLQAMPSFSIDASAMSGLNGIVVPSDLFPRPASAPPTTPSWDTALTNHDDGYFA